MNLIDKAMYAAIKAHEGQVRKYTGEPYWFHLRSVTRRVAHKDGTEVMIAAAWMHDTIEDTDITYGDIRRELGQEVADLVIELTDAYTHEAFPKWNRAKRKQAECKRMAGLSDEAKVIKLCDLADNPSSIIEHDPKFAIVYLREKADLLEVLI